MIFGIYTILEVIVMEDILFYAGIGAAVYVVLSIVIDAAFFMLKSLNRMQFGSVGVLLNGVLVMVVSWLRSRFFSNDILFYVVCGTCAINFIVSCFYIVLGMTSFDLGRCR